MDNILYGRKPAAGKGPKWINYKNTSKP